MDYGQLKQRLGRRRGFDGNINRLGDFINDAYMTICGRRSNWSWLRRVAQIHTYGPMAGQTAHSWDVGQNVQGFTAADSPAPSGLHKIMEDTFSGAKLQGPDGCLYRIRSRGPLNADGVADAAGDNFYLETPYFGAYDSAFKAKLYTDEYPLPLACGEVESVVYTGNGQTSRVRSLSLLPQHMHGLSINSYESYPSHYSIEQTGTIPAPDVAPTVPGTGGMWSRCKYRYYNTRTLEMGPFSDETAFGGGGGTNVITGTRHSDYGVAFYRTRWMNVDPGRNSGQEFFFVGIADRDDMSAAPSVQESFADNQLGVAGANQFYDIDGGGSNVTGDIVGALSAGRAYEAGTTQRIRFWPPPDAAYLVEIKYFVVPQELRLDNDVPLVPRQFHPAVLDLAESLALSEEENHGAASVKRQFAMETVNRMERDDEKDPGTSIQIGRGGVHGTAQDGFGKEPGLTVVVPPTNVGPWGS